MLKKLEYICVVGTIALIGADRIDLLGGHASFKLTPFLFLASLIVLNHLLLMVGRGGFQVTLSPPVRRQIPFLFLLVPFLLLASTSTVIGLNPERGLVALFDMVLVAALGYGISVRILADPAPEKLVVRSVTIGLIVWMIFCVGGYIAWIEGLSRVGEETSWSFASIFAPTASFLFVPRLSGYCLDANRAGFILVMYLVLLDRFVTKTRYTRLLRFVIGFFILLSLSRSATLCWFAYYLFSGTFWQRLKDRRVAFGAAALAIICLLVGLAYQEEIAELSDLWQVSDIVSNRLSGEQGTSGGDHIQLIQRGFETWSSSIHTMVTGIGFASAPRVLTDFFGDDKYGNFHCLYVSVLAELGLPAFLLLLILLGYPTIGRKGTVSGIAAIAIFNLPYQSNMEPIFWVVLALMWSSEPKNWRARNLASATLKPRYAPYESGLGSS
jgi:hypothetical protein